MLAASGLNTVETLETNFESLSSTSLHLQWLGQAGSPLY